MLSSITKFVLFNIILIVSILTLILFYLRFITINESFYSYSLNKDGVYQNLTRSLKLTAHDFILKQFVNSSDYDNLSAPEKQDIENQIENLTSFINKENVADFFTNNLKNIIAYLHGKSDDLNLYLPIDRWGISKDFQNQIPDYLKSTNVNLRDILKSQGLDTPDNLKILDSLKSSSNTLIIAILVGTGVNIFLTTFYALINKRGDRVAAVGKLMTFLGIVILFISWIIFSFHNALLQRVILQNGTSGNILFILLPIFIKPLTFIFSVYGLGELIFGIILYNMKNKKQLVSGTQFR